MQSSALCLLNRVGSDILDRRLNGEAAARIADRLAQDYNVEASTIAADIASLEAAWREANLVIDEAPSPGFAEGGTPPAAADFRCSLRISCGGRGVRLRCEEPLLAELLTAVTAPARNLAAEEPDIIDVYFRNNSFRGWVGGRHLWSTGERAIARHWALRDAIEASLAPDPPVAILHAAGISLDERGVVLAALSGSGKSTLACGLLAQGGKLLSDDLLPLCGDGRSIAPVPFAISVKSGSWPLVSEIFPQLSGKRVFGNRNLKIRYLWPGVGYTAQSRAPTSLIVSPRWDADAAARAERLSAEETASMLIETGTRLAKSEGAVAAFARFAEAVPAYRVSYPDVGAGIELVRALLDVQEKDAGDEAGLPVSATGCG